MAVVWIGLIPFVYQWTPQYYYNYGTKMLLEPSFCSPRRDKFSEGHATD